MRNLSIALFAIARLALGQSQPPTPTPGVVGKTQQQKKADKNAVSKTNDQSPSRSAQPVSPPETEKTKSESAKGTQPPVVVNVNIPKSDFKVADWFLVVFTGGLVGVGYLQWRILKDHHSVMDRQADYIKDAFEETRKANVAAGDALRITQAAEVHILTIESSTPNEFRPDTSFSVTFKNFGRTSALRFRNDLVMGQEDAPNRQINPTGLISIPLAPDQPMNIAFEIVGAILQGGFPDIASGKKRLVIKGQFSYDDVFGAHHAFAVEAVYDTQHHNWIVTKNEPAESAR